jgi:hypothetical protein
MVIRAAKEGLEIREVPIRYHPRGGESKLSTFRDGWRHLRFLLVHSPTYLFIVPGLAMAVLGALLAVTVLARIDLLGRTWDIHVMIAGALLMIVGTQVTAMGVCAHAYGTYFMGTKDLWFDTLRARFRLEHGLLLGAAVTLAGLALCAYVGITWIERGFGRLAEERIAVLATAVVVIGIQIFFSSFLVSILGLRRGDG